MNNALTASMIRCGKVLQLNIGFAPFSSGLSLYVDVFFLSLVHRVMWSDASFHLVFVSILMRSFYMSSVLAVFVESAVEKIYRDSGIKSRFRAVIPNRNLLSFASSFGRGEVAEWLKALPC